MLFLKFQLIRKFVLAHHFYGVVFLFISLKGGDPAAPSDTATLLRLHPSHQFYLRQLPPIARLAH